MFSYSVAIRTLGKSGDKYQATLQSVVSQTIPPSSINVYIPYGYELPKETVGTEKYFRCEKGMIAQRALKYEEIKDEWILFLDDDMFLPMDFMQRAYDFIKKHNVDSISTNVFPNHDASIAKKIAAAFNSVLPMCSSYWGFKVTRCGRYRYNNNPPNDFMHSQTGSGNCILCKKESFMSIHYEDEVWMDKFGYALGDDQLMNYKIFLRGGEEYVWYNSGVKHLDAGSKNRRFDTTHIRKTTACLFLVWHRSIFNLKSNSFFKKGIAVCALAMSLLLKFLFNFIYIFKGVYLAPIAIIQGIMDGIKFTKTDIYSKQKLFDVQDKI